MKHVIFLLLALIIATGGLMAQDLKVGLLTAQPGEIISGMLDVSGDPATQIPVTLIRGAKPGLTLGLVAGNHGYEYTPILALQQLRQRIKPDQLKGSLIMVHIANLPSFQGRTIYYSPADGKNLNRSYPGSEAGTTSERIAYRITHDVIEQSDYVLDLHCGDGNESLRPYVYQPVTGQEALDEKMRQMALAFGMDHIVLERERPTDPEKSIYCSTTAVTRGKPALTVESGYLGTRDAESVNRIVNGVENLMRHLGMMEGDAGTLEHPIYLEPTQVLTSPATGILYPKVERDQTVAKGTLLATVTDYFGKTLAEVRAPFGGIVLYVVATPPIREGEPVAMVGAVKP